MIHTFFDGVSIASAFLVNLRVGLLVFIAIMLHKVPEGFTVASIMLASGRSPKKAAAAALALGAATFAGVVGVALLQERFAKLGRLCASLFGRRHLVRGGERLDSGS